MALEAQKLQEVQEIAAVRATEEVSRIRDMRAALADERARVASRAGASFDGTGSFSWTADGQQTDVTWTGAFRVSGDGRDVATIEPGASVRLSDGPWALSTGVEVSALADGSLEHTFFVNGQEQPYDTDARDFLAEMLSRVVRWGGAQLR